jgi:hypothetical protein
VNGRNRTTKGKFTLLNLLPDVDEVPSCSLTESVLQDKLDLNRETCDHVLTMKFRLFC